MELHSYAKKGDGKEKWSVATQWKRTDEHGNEKAWHGQALLSNGIA